MERSRKRGSENVGEMKTDGKKKKKKNEMRIAREKV
jgi:hypothetical protein